MSAHDTIHKVMLTGLAALVALAAAMVVAVTPSVAVQEYASTPIAPVFGEQLPVEDITGTTAVVSAELNPENDATTYRVLYGVSNSFGLHTAEIKAGAGFGEETVVATLTSLTPSTTYHYEFKASNSQGSATGLEETLTTGPPSPPTTTTGEASNITLTTATVSGAIGPEGLETSYELDLGTDTTYGTSIFGKAGGGAENVGVSVNLQDLAPGTTYHYRFVAMNSDGRAYGADQTFTTLAYAHPLVLPPVLVLLPTPAIAFPTETQTLEANGKAHNANGKTKKKRHKGKTVRKKSKRYKKK